MKPATIQSVLALGAFLTPTLALPMEPQLAKHYAELLEKRQGPGTLVEVVAGIFIEIVAEGIGDIALSDAVNAIAATFNPAGPKAPWENPDNCQISFHTQGGEHCYAHTVPASSSGASETAANTHNDNWNVCPWINPASTAPPVQYFTDPGIGDYSIRHTATDTVAWIDPSMGPSGSSERCVAQGLCNPQFRFYRNGYDLVVNSWQLTSTNGADSGGYSGQYVGICSGAQVLDQFSRGGDVLGSKCAIPCGNQAMLPDGHNTK